MKYCPQCKQDLHQIKEDGFPRAVCQNCHFVFYNNPRPCVMAVIMQDKRVLLYERGIEPGLGLWDLPGGFVEHMEHPEEALKREIREELGTEIHDVRYFGVYMDRYGDEIFSTLNIAYLCELSGIPKSNSNEINKIRYFPLDSLPEKYAFPSIKNVLAGLKHGSNHAL